MKIKIGIAPIAWSNDDMPELGGDTPIEICLDEAKKAGFSGIELGGKFPRNPGITNYLLNKFQLKMPGGWYGSQLRSRSINEEWIAMQDQINLLKIIILETKISMKSLRPLLFALKKMKLFMMIIKYQKIKKFLLYRRLEVVDVSL